MTAFPALVPSSRTFTPGESPATAFAGYSGAQGRVRHSNVFLAAQLRLVFLGLTQSQMLDIWNHYNGRRGELRSFALSAEVLSYGNITDYVPGNYLWRYAGPGSVEDLPCGGHNVSLTIETVPPDAASVVGAQLLISLRMSAGAAAGGDFALGISESISLSLIGGDPFTALNGINQSLQVSIEPGPAVGDIALLGEYYAIEISMTTVTAQNAGAAGISESINFSLVAGAADNGGILDPSFSSVSLLLHGEGANQSTTFTDSSSNQLSPTVTGGAIISTAQFKFGTASIYSPNSSTLTYGASSLFDVGAGIAFTVELFLRNPNAAQSGIPFLALAPPTGVGLFSLQLRSSGRLRWQLANTSVTSYQTLTDTATGIQQQDTWHHVAMVGSGTQLNLYIDGVSVLSASQPNWNSGNRHLTLFGGNGFTLSCFIDEFRFTKGVARYTANFTPPTAAFPNS